jgi:orotidine-5'-phosphate decarboxylase
MTPPLDRLRARLETVGAALCLGLDPHPAALPDELARDAQGIETFARGILEAAADSVVAVKVNLAFFEAFGAAGWAALERLRRDVPDDVPLIIDAKRGDIGSTADRQATSIFEVLEADGVTVSPYLGEDAIAPFLAYEERIVYVLARTSNPSAGTLQDVAVGAIPLYRHVAEWVAQRWPEPRVGLVVGATAPGELAELRTAVPGPAFLVPGVGAQGGDLAAAVRACHGTQAPGLVSVSRAIAHASSGPNWRAAAAAAAREMVAAMREVGATLPA